MSKMRIEDWAVIYGDHSSGVFSTDNRITGTVYGHPDFPDGSVITTTRIMDCTNRVITTLSGSLYTLGEPHPEYVAWCKSKGFVIDEETPIKMKIIGEEDEVN